LTFANLLETGLTPDQIRLISDHADVKQILLNSSDMVTA
jgi:hypothetical protein